MSKIIHALGCVVVTVVLCNAFGCVAGVEESEPAELGLEEQGGKPQNCAQLFQNTPAVPGGNALYCSCGLTAMGEERGVSLCVTFNCAVEHAAAHNLCARYCGCRTEIETPDLVVSCGGPNLNACP